MPQRSHGGNTIRLDQKIEARIRPDAAITQAPVIGVGRKVDDDATVLASAVITHFLKIVVA
jgi:hypothetical protein